MQYSCGEHIILGCVTVNNIRVVGGVAAGSDPHVTTDMTRQEVVGQAKKII